ncbi:MAG: hypothetical protein HY904_02120 [Deltaproteobacteria bacterium]|nr:hypothetical protein [Deltaproteobacteria bacterium]
MRPLLSSVVLAWLALAPGCRSLPIAPAGVRDALDAKYAGGYFTLKQSMYFGPFWDAPDLVLLDARPFHSLSYLVVGSRPVPPGTEHGIIPAGTRVRVEKVDLPSLGSMAGRPNLSPRYNGWLRVRVNRFDTSAPGFRDGLHVLVLPLGLTDLGALEGAIQQLLGDDDAFKAWLDGRTPEMRAAIAEKRPRVGMLYEELVAALGPPDAMVSDVVPEGRREVAEFPRYQVTLVESLVRAVETRP